MVKITIDKARLERAIKSNPLAVRNGALVFMRDGINSYWRIIHNTPKWRVGASSGGVPVANDNGGNLRKAHEKSISPFESRIFINQNKTKRGKYDYAELVSGGTKKMTKRPWLKFAFETSSVNILMYQNKFLKDVVYNLTK